ncbi:hypothetical protein AVEN_264301-1 [Araneus ventricosus]|uniref:Uncharacterized protein n=1 Tax=Araneus ventricosus TaxID=182803 RepID=A0A4Y2E3K0_ARAVE|nr:hypothetical protein AVEN_264301-1 [Araneus ventricosus]
MTKATVLWSCVQQYRRNCQSCISFFFCLRSVAKEITRLFEICQKRIKTICFGGTEPERYPKKCPVQKQNSSRVLLEDQSSKAFKVLRDKPQELFS